MQLEEVFLLKIEQMSRAMNTNAMHVKRTKHVLLGVIMEKFRNLNDMNFGDLPVDEFWNLGDSREKKMHRIHSYPAKFPAFITGKALDFAKNQGLKVSKVADVFCGCGTVAFEAKRNNIDFWGCDINPVATMIAKVKSRNYSKTWLDKYYYEILSNYHENPYYPNYSVANERLQYWYDERIYNDLSKLKAAILNVTPTRSDYRLFYLCAFSNILKSTSRWLAKSIKPQLDPKKQFPDVLSVFAKQFTFMVKANDETGSRMKSRNVIKTGNILTMANIEKVDMIITSPPYVTSYEYADLHQLSSLWLDYTNDYKKLRQGSIGSTYKSNSENHNTKIYLNRTADEIISKLTHVDKSKARSVKKYFIDIQQVAIICYNMLTDGGIALFVIGNTEYKGVKVDNAKHLSESLLKAGFCDLRVTKRSIRGKTLTPFRNKQGRFTTDSNSRQVYAEEFIIVGRKQ